MAAVPGIAPGRHGFMGYPRAQVVAPEILTERSKDYVAYKIRVADDSGEWSVTRRFREFEGLHRRLKERPRFQELGLKLPAKRIFYHNHDVKFINKRRTELDHYLTALMRCTELAMAEEVWLFLSRTTEWYPGASGADQDAACDAELVSRLAAAVPLSHHGLAAAAAPGGGAAAAAGGQHRSASAGSSPASKPPRHQRLEAIGAAAVAPGLSLMSPGGTLRSTPDSPFTAAAGAAGQQAPAAAARSRRGSAEENGSSGGGMPHAWGAAGQEDAWGVEAAAAANAASVPQGLSSAPSSAGSGGDVLPSDQQGLLGLETVQVSAPLYDLVDALFGLQSRGFFRRQVIIFARQLLSLLAGDAIEVYLLNQLKLLGAEHTIARAILLLQSSLWPNGTWFAWAQPQQQAQAQAQTPPQTPATGGRPLPAGMKAERFLEPGSKPHDEAEVAVALRKALLSSAPPALVRLLGVKCYTRSVQDLYDMLQSATFTAQMGYGLLELVLVGLCPEMQPLINRIQREGSEAGVVAMLRGAAKQA